jgi:Uma2 family endonuclease
MRIALDLMTLEGCGDAMLAYVPCPEPDPMAMPQTIPWTRADLDRLPDDGNRYEVLDGELLVTPPPSTAHQEIVDWLAERLFPFVAANGLGRLRFPRSVIVAEGSQLEPDMMVRPISPPREWEQAPLPTLVVEVLSRSSRRRDLYSKREFYLNRGVPEYWAVDRDERAVIRFARGETETLRSILRWSPPGTTSTLEIDVAAMFAEILPRSADPSLRSG